MLLGILIGLSAAFVPAPVFSLVPKFLPSGQIGIGYELLSTCLNIDVLVGPMLIGFSYNQTLSYQQGFILWLFLLSLRYFWLLSSVGSVLE